MHNRPTPSLPRPALGDLSARANLSAARRRVLEVVEASNDAMTAVQVASALNLHHNTVREHLDALVDAGFVTVSTKPTGKRGRPALRYASTAPDPQQMVDAYLLLLDAIADTLGEGEEAQATALEIGRRWAELTPGTVAEPTVDGEQVPGFQVHLGGGLATDGRAEAGLGRTVRGLKVPASGLTDYVERLVRRYLDQRVPEETFAQWAHRADEEALQ